MREFDLYDVARFWSKVDVGRQTDCWEWRGGETNFGYGRFRIGGKLESPHRLAYLMAKGPIPDDPSYHGKVVMHVCDNPHCVNPSHLRLGSQQDNVHDMMEKQRQTINRERGKHLTPEQIEVLVTDPRPLRQIAKIYGISKAHLSRLRRRAKEQKERAA